MPENKANSWCFIHKSSRQRNINRMEWYKPLPGGILRMRGLCTTVLTKYTFWYIRCITAINISYGNFWPNGLAIWYWIFGLQVFISLAFRFRPSNPASFQFEFTLPYFGQNKGSSWMSMCSLLSLKSDSKFYDFAVETILKTFLFLFFYFKRFADLNNDLLSGLERGVFVFDFIHA